MIEKRHMLELVSRENERQDRREALKSEIRSNKRRRKQQQQQQQQQHSQKGSSYHHVDNTNNDDDDNNDNNGSDEEIDNMPDALLTETDIIEDLKKTETIREAAAVVMGDARADLASADQFLGVYATEYVIK